MANLASSWMYSRNAPSIRIKCSYTHRTAAKNRQKKSLTPTNTPYFGGSRSFKVIKVDTPKKLITSACYDKQHVYAYLQLFSR